MIFRSLGPPCLLLLSSFAAGDVFFDGFEAPAMAEEAWDVFSEAGPWSATFGQFEIGWKDLYGVDGAGDRQVLELDSYANSGLATVIDTVAGQTYRVSFLAANREGTDANTNTFDVLWDDAIQLSVQPASFGMTLYSFQITATGSKSTLALISTGFEDGLGGIVDNVRVEAVPEPASCLVLLGGLALLSRRRR